MARSSRTCSPARPWRRIGEWVRRGRPRELCSRALAKGTRPLGFPSFWGGGGDGRLRPPPCLAGTPFVVDRPPTHFFVKKKFGSIGGAEFTTQRVSSGFCYAHTLCGGGTLCDARNPQQEALAQALLGAESTPHAEGSFFLYEKSVLGESDCLRGRRTEVCTDLTPPLFCP